MTEHRRLVRPLAALMPALLCACHEHVLLMFPTQSASAEYYECQAATDARPEARAAQCKKVVNMDPARENQAFTRHVDVPACEGSDHYYRIAILNADSSSPTVLVRCAQFQSPLHGEP